MDVLNCQDLAVPPGVMQHVVNIESSNNPYAIGVVGGRLARQPRTLAEALATVRMLEGRRFNFSLGLAQVNRHNLGKYGLKSYEAAFQACPNLQAGARILAACRAQAGNDWGKAFSCYYSGDFVTGFRDGYVQRIFASMHGMQSPVAVTGQARAIELVGISPRRSVLPTRQPPPGALSGWRSIPEAVPQRAAQRADAPAPAGALADPVASAEPTAVEIMGASPPASTDQAFVF